jgi:hypothetical protein
MFRFARPTQMMVVVATVVAILTALTDRETRPAESRHAHYRDYWGLRPGMGQAQGGE